jgi:hypothetical protein
VEVTLLAGWHWYVGAPDQVPAGSYDYSTVLLHELGHAVGLDHSPDLRSAMFSLLAAGTAHRHLAAADIDRLLTLYGAKAAPTQANAGNSTHALVRSPLRALENQPGAGEAPLPLWGLVFGSSNHSWPQSGKAAGANEDVLTRQARDLLFAADQPLLKPEEAQATGVGRVSESSWDVESIPGLFDWSGDWQAMRLRSRTM